jgi:RNA polymerase sigma factor (sigma-70 family)
MAYSPESDEALVLRLLPITNGSLADRNAAWAELDSAYREGLRRYIRQWMSSDAEVEEIYQDTLITAFMNVENGSFTYTGVPFLAYLKAIARNKVLAERRRTGRWVELDDDLATPGGDERQQPEILVESREEQDEVMAAIGQLSSKTRRVILGVMQGKQNSEMAQEFAMTEEAVRQHKSRGVRSLQQLVSF